MVLGFAPICSAGPLYVSNYNAGTIDQVDAAGNVHFFVPTGSGLRFPFALAFDSIGNLYVTKSANGTTISQVTPAGVVSTFATGLNGPVGLAFDHQGNLYTANYHGNSVSRITFSAPGTFGSISTFFAGSPLSTPESLTIDSNDNLYVTNGGPNRDIIKITSSGISSVFVTGLASQPDDLAFDSSGNLYVSQFLHQHCHQNHAEWCRQHLCLWI